MALLHEVLYCSDNLARVNFAAYVARLLQNLQSSHGSIFSRVTLIKQVSPVALPMELSLPCGLMIITMTPPAGGGLAFALVFPAPPDSLSKD
jgi:two-component sensor histidine kinase